jgi:hypothetical protein
VIRKADVTVAASRKEKVRSAARLCIGCNTLYRQARCRPGGMCCSLEALANHEINAAAVTPTAAYFNLTHPDKAIRILGPDENEANLNWNVAVGMVRPDERLRDAIEGLSSGCVPMGRSSEYTGATGSCCNRRDSFAACHSEQGWPRYRRQRGK